MSAIVLAYITAGSETEARSLARTLVEEELAACVNVFPGITSVYRWEGEVEEAAELVLIAKLKAEDFPALCHRVRQLHSYKVPCVLEIPLARGTPDYLAWLAGAAK